MSKESVKRVEEYIARRKKSRGIDVQHIHGFDVGPDCGVELLLSDIEAIISAAAPQVVADERELPEMTDDLIFQWAEGYVFTLKGMPHRMTFTRPRFVAAVRTIIAHLPAAAPVQAQETVAGTAVEAVLLSDMTEGSHPQYGNGLFATENCVTTLYRAPVQPVAEPDGALATTIELARCIWRDNYKNEAPDWEPLTDLAGVLSQIDNMVCGMRRAAPAAQGDSLIESNLREIITKTSDDYARYVAQTTLAAIAAKAAS